MIIFYVIVILEEKITPKFEIEKIEILDKSFQIILRIYMIIYNENKKLSRNRKKRIELKIKMDDKMKAFSNKINFQKKKKKLIN